MAVPLIAFYLPGNVCFLPLRMFTVGKTRCPISSVTPGLPLVCMGWEVRINWFSGAQFPCAFLTVSTSRYTETDLRVFEDIGFSYNMSMNRPCNHFFWCSNGETASLTLE